MTNERPNLAILDGDDNFLRTFKLAVENLGYGVPVATFHHVAALNAIARLSQKNIDAVFIGDWGKKRKEQSILVDSVFQIGRVRPKAIGLIYQIGDESNADLTLIKSVKPDDLAEFLSNLPIVWSR